MGKGFGVSLGVAIRGMALVYFCVALLGGAPTAAARGLEAAELEKAANVGEGGLLMYAAASFGTANGGRMHVDFVSGVLAQSAQRIHLLSYDRITKSFREDISFETVSIRGVALAKGPFGRKQLQIQTETGILACDLGGKVTTQIYDRLVAAGTPTFTSPGLVTAVVIPQPVVITIYMPTN